jgi:N6-L-threonylcarbamoyladenine synthase
MPSPLPIYSRILALESSCDDTACAIVEDGRRVVVSVIQSQLDVHAPYGGVIPELAARSHLKQVNAVVAHALESAGFGLDDMDAMAGTLGPGLIGSLLVGANTAKTLALLANKPFLGVHHLQAHVASNYLESDLAPSFICLLVSGGHTQLIQVTDYQNMTCLGETLDDAVGEVYDKLAREMGLGFPGGATLDALAQKGNPKAFPLPIAKTQAPYDFSFSGLKTAALKTWRTQAQPYWDASIPVPTSVVQDVAASFQYAVVQALLRKTLALLQATGIQQVALAGGVSANTALRQAFLNLKSQGIHVHLPALRFCTDNAAMVGASAYFNPWTRERLDVDVFSRG